MSAKKVQVTSIETVKQKVSRTITLPTKPFSFTSNPRAINVTSWFLVRPTLNQSNDSSTYMLDIVFLDSKLGLISSTFKTCVNSWFDFEKFSFEITKQVGSNCAFIAEATYRHIIDQFGQKRKINEFKKQVNLFIKALATT